MIEIIIYHLDIMDIKKFHNDYFWKLLRINYFMISIRNIKNNF